MQQIGAARQDQGGQAGQQGSNESIQALATTTSELAQKALEVARIAKAIHPPVLAYISKIAEITEAMQGEIKDLMARQQQGAQMPQGSPAGQTPTEGTPAGAS
jgi:hypothetical protein